MKITTYEEDGVLWAQVITSLGVGDSSLGICFFALAENFVICDLEGGYYA